MGKHDINPAVVPIMATLTFLLGLALFSHVVTGDGIGGERTVSNVAGEASHAVLESTGDGMPAESLYDLTRHYPKLAEEDNIFIVASSDDALSFLSEGTGVMMLGYPECPWCQEYIPRIGKLARDGGIGKVLYYDVKKSRLDEPQAYARLLELLGGEDGIPERNDEGELRVFVPLLLMVDHGEIIYSNDDTAHIKESDGVKPAEYWNDDVDGAFSRKISEKMDGIAEAIRECGECS
jgi:hypothetical protein